MDIIDISPEWFNNKLKEQIAETEEYKRKNAELDKRITELTKELDKTPIIKSDDIWFPMAVALEEKKREIDLEERQKIQRINTELNFIFDQSVKQLKKITYNEQYIIKNKYKLTERIECVCGKSYEKWNKSNHTKTKHHKQHITPSN